MDGHLWRHPRVPQLYPDTTPVEKVPWVALVLHTQGNAQAARRLKDVSDGRVSYGSGLGNLTALPGRKGGGRDRERKAMRREKGEQKKGDDKRTTKASAIQGAAARNGNQTHVRLGQAVSVGNTAPNKRGTPPPPPRGQAVAPSSPKWTTCQPHTQRKTKHKHRFPPCTTFPRPSLPARQQTLHPLRPPLVPSAWHPYLRERIVDVEISGINDDPPGRIHLRLELGAPRGGRHDGGCHRPW